MTATRARFGSRISAALIDAVLGGVLTLLLSGTSGHWFSERAVIMLSIGSPDTFWNGPIPYIIGVFGSVVYGAPFAFLLVTLSGAFFGATPGKWLLRLHVISADDRPATHRMLLVRWAVKSVGLWGLVVALVVGKSAVAAVAVILGAVVLLGFLAALGPTRQALHDRLAGTAVTSTGVARRERLC